MTCSVSSSRWAVGSSSSTQGRSATTTRARASRARSPADRVVPSSPSGLSRPVGQGPDPLLERHLAQCGPEHARRRRPVDPGAGCRRSLPRTKCGRWGSQATCACQSGPPTRWPSAVIDAAGEREQPGQRVEQRRLAAAARAGDDGDAGGREHGVERLPPPAARRPSWVTVTPAQQQRRRRRGAGPGSRDPLVGSLPVRARPGRPRTWPPPRPRRGTRRRPGAAASTPPEPAAGRPGRCAAPATRRPAGRPIVTATSATESVATSSSTSEEANAIRSVPQRGEAVAVGDRRDPAATAPGRGGARPGSAARASTSRKWPDSDAISRHCSRARSRVARPTRAPKTGTSGRVASTIDGAEQVLGGDRDDGRAAAARRRAPAPAGSGSGRARRPRPRGWPARDTAPVGPRQVPLDGARSRAGAAGEVPTTAAARAAARSPTHRPRPAPGPARRPATQRGAGQVVAAQHGQHQAGHGPGLARAPGRCTSHAARQHRQQLAPARAPAADAARGRTASSGRRGSAHVASGCGARRSACGTPSRSSAW